jgi:hypothetical protein
MGQAARECVVAHFNRHVQARDFVAVLATTAGPERVK